MRLTAFLIPLLFLASALNAQVETIIKDGEYGISVEYETDTLVVTRVVKGKSADRAGIHAGDKILYINDNKVSGAGLNEVELQSYMYASAETEMKLQIIKEGTASLTDCSIFLDFSRDMGAECYYDYLVDSLDRLTASQLFSDSIGRPFSQIIENGITIHSLHNESGSRQLPDIRPGDKLLSFNIGIDSWAKLMFKEYTDADTVIRILRDSTEFDLHTDLREFPELQINSMFSHDMQQESIWIRMIFTKRLIEDKTILVRFDDPLDSIQLYHKRQDGTILEKMTGTDIKDNKCDPFYKSKPVIRLSIREDIQDTVFVRLYQSGGLNFAQHIDILTYEYVSQFEQVERLILGAILGIMFIIVFYYFILYLFMKDRSYFIYLLFIISLSFTLFDLSGYGAQFIWPKSISFFTNIQILFITLPMTFFLLFDAIYLDMRKTLRNWYRSGRILIYILWAFSAMMLVDSFANDTNKWSDFGLLLEIVYGLCLAALLLIIYITAILKIREHYRPAWYLLIGIVILCISVIIYSISGPLTGILSSSFNLSEDITAIFLNASIFIGAIIQFLIFSVGLGQKMKDYDRDVKIAQENLIKQLKVNEKLKDKQNKELEEKVIERTKEIRTQKEEIEAQHTLVSEQNKEITDSINYAKKIQTAVLPSSDLLDELLPEHFVLFMPRDIVSGDFYWIKQIKNFTVVVAADCTGHGVPGAFMSMLGVSMLNEIVGRSRLDSAGEFLDRLRSKVKSTLSQEGKDLEQKDGMDMSLAILDSESNELQYAGAFNPIYIIRNKPASKKDKLSEFLTIKRNGTYLYEIKGDRQPISIYSKEKEFKTNYVQLDKEDSLYMFSDGYPDQMGGPRGKKFMVKKFKELLLSIQNESMIAQKEVLDNTLADWKKDVQQIDDILVFGIKWK